MCPSHDPRSTENGNSLNPGENIMLSHFILKTNCKLRNEWIPCKLQLISKRLSNYFQTNSGVKAFGRLLDICTPRRVKIRATPLTNHLKGVLAIRPQSKTRAALNPLNYPNTFGIRRANI